MRVLIADDDPVIRTLLKGLLGKAGHAVEVVTDGASALAVLEGAEAPPLALLDWVMPGLQGTEVCRRVRERRPPAQPYLILLTSRGREEDVVAGFEAGADDYIIKPFGPNEVRARVGVGERIVTLQRALVDRVAELEATLAELKQLQGLLPMCAWCKKVRNEDQYWERVETYISARSQATFTHGICPECRVQILARAGEPGESPR